MTQLNIQIQQVSSGDFVYIVSFDYKMAKYKASGSASDYPTAFQVACQYIERITEAE